MSTAALECEALCVGYDGVQTVHDLDLRFEPGQVTAVLGPNGAGKTTTLLALSGLLRPMAGAVRLGGRPVRPGRPHLAARDGLSFVPDDRGLFYQLSARQNLRLGVRGGSVRGTIDDVLEYFPPLRKLLDRRAGLLSGGEQQMLAIARALASRPKVLMVDEMSLGLAPVIVQRLLPVVRRIADETGTAVVMVEQHVDLALGVADHAYVLDRGRLALAAAAADLRGRHDLLQASYMGERAYEQVEDKLGDGASPTLEGSNHRA